MKKRRLNRQKFHQKNKVSHSSARSGSRSQHHSQQKGHGHDSRPPEDLQHSSHHQSSSQTKRSGSGKLRVSSSSNARGLKDIIQRGAVSSQDAPPRNSEGGGRGSKTPTYYMWTADGRPVDKNLSAASSPKGLSTSTKPTSIAQSQQSSRLPAKLETLTSDRSTSGVDLSKDRFEDSDTELLEGIIKRHPDGFGFFIPDSDSRDENGNLWPDVYISRTDMSGIMSNDRVKVRLDARSLRARKRQQNSRFKKGKAQQNNSTQKEFKSDDRLSGHVVAVLERAQRRVVGVYLPVDRRYGVILEEGRGWGMDLRIAAEDSMKAKNGELVAVEIITYPDSPHGFTGKVVEILGSIENPMNDIRRIVYAHQLNPEFPAEVLAEARHWGQHVSEADKNTVGRRDIRHLDLITIDGVTARDFDDAIYVERIGDELGKSKHNHHEYRLWVAIADVSHYVRPGTAIDREAFLRGTSTYFPNAVLPMLPEELSNELCSLKPQVDRLCFVCEMKISSQGEITHYEFYEGVMNSRARVTYGEAQQVLDGDVPLHLQKLASCIERAAELARVLMKKRFKEGSLDLEIPETQVVVDISGETTDIIRASRLFAHRLIEELMLAANISTARFFDKMKIPGIYRIHEPPVEENIKGLERYMHNFGASVRLGLSHDQNLQKKLTRALAHFEGQPEAQILHILTLRSMQQARYSSQNLGHFGLAFGHYSHFTSPIRRYPDLIAHRQIKAHLQGSVHNDRRHEALSEEEMERVGQFSSACEQRSVKAERALIAIKKARFMLPHVGEEFDGIISSVTKFGFFVLLHTYDVDGLVKLEELGHDRWNFDPGTLTLKGQRSGRVYCIGDAVRVQIIKSDIDNGRIEFSLIQLSDKTSGDPKRKSQDKTKKENKKSRKKSKDKISSKKEKIKKAKMKP